MQNLDVVAKAISELLHQADTQWFLSQQNDHASFHVSIDYASFDVTLTPDQQLLWRHESHLPAGHLSDVIMEALSTAEESFSGQWVFETKTSGAAQITYLAAMDLQNAEPSDSNVSESIAGELIQLDNILAHCAVRAQMRERIDATLDEEEKEWATAALALVDDSTPVEQLAVVFDRFSTSGVHEHVFYHPNADVALRQHIIEDWSRSAPANATQPYGNPEASFSCFAEQRQESVAALMDQ